MGCIQLVAQQGMCLYAQPLALSAVRFMPEAFPLPGIGREANQVPPVRILSLPIDRISEGVELAEGTEQLCPLRLLPSQRGQRGSLLLRRREALDDRSGQHRMRADLQEEIVIIVQERLHRSREVNRVAHVLPPVGGIEFGPLDCTTRGG